MLPQGCNCEESREEAVKLVKDEGLTVMEACSRLSLPESTLEAWVRAAGKGALGEIGKGQRTLRGMKELQFEYPLWMMAGCLKYH